MLEHYRDLFRLFRSSILWGMVIAGVLAYGLSLFLLKTLPSYASTVTMNMQPSEEALRFNQEFTGVGQFNPATIITQTHIERLLSDPVVERALDILLAQADGAPPVDEPDLIDDIKTFVWTWWAKLNYGFFEPPDQRTEYLDILRKSVDVDFVEGSYILRLEATSQYPELAARIANAYATAYTQIASDDFLDQAFSSATIVEDRIKARESSLREMLEEREELRERLDVSDVNRELTVLLEARRNAVEALQTAQIDLFKLENELEYQMRTLGSREGGSTGALEPQRRKIADQQDEIAFRQQVVDDIDRDLDGLGKKERQLTNLTNSIEAAEQDLEILRERLVSLDLSSNARMSQLRIVSAAKPSVYPDFPKVFMNTAIAPIVGGLLVIVVLVFGDAVGNRVRTQANLQDIVGPRTLPTIKPRLRARFRNGQFTGGRVARRRLKKFADTLGQRLSAGSGLSEQTVLVTGFLEEDQINRVASILKAAIETRFGNVGKDTNEDKIKVVPVPPVSAVANWDDLPDGSVVVAVPANTVEDIELKAMNELGSRKARKPFMLIWS